MNAHICCPVVACSIGHLLLFVPQYQYFEVTLCGQSLYMQERNKINLIFASYRLDGMEQFSHRLTQETKVKIVVENHWTMRCSNL